jgi:DNA-binding MarR family transcriptional regulator
MEDLDTGTLGTADRESVVARGDKLELRVWLRLLTCSNLIETRVRAGLSMGGLSERLMVSNGNVTGLVDRLVTEGLVARLPSPEDRRQSRVKLTAAGKRAFDEMTPQHERWVDDLLAGMSRGDMAQLLELLAKLKQSVIAANGDRS